jgi:hypothetical protein
MCSYASYVSCKENKPFLIRYMCKYFLGNISTEVWLDCNKLVNIKLVYVWYIYRDIFKLLKGSTALRFKATGAPLAARCIQILPINRYVSWPVTFGMKRTNKSVERLTTLCFTASSVVHAWEFDYDVSSRLQLSAPQCVTSSCRIT